LSGAGVVETMFPERRTVAVTGAVGAAMTGSVLFGDLAFEVAAASDAVSSPAAYETLYWTTFGLVVLAVFVLPTVAAYWLVREAESAAVGRLLGAFAVACWLSVFAYAAVHNATASGVLADHRGLRWVTSRALLPFLPAVLGVVAGHVLHHDGPMFGPAFEAPRPDGGPGSGSE
jgi:hypothetical protein